MKPIYIVFLAAMAVFLQGCYDEPVANFDYSYTDNVAPAVVSFSNYSTDAEEYLWNFGDGNTSTQQSPTHTYEEGGTFSISLKASGRGGDNTMSKSITIIDPQTSYIVRNSSSLTLYNVLSFYWDGANIIDDVNHGTMGPGAESSEVITEHDVINMGFELSDGTIVIVVNPFNLTLNTLNYLTITDQTQIYTGKKSTGKGVNSIEELQLIRETREPVLLKDVLE